MNIPSIKTRSSVSQDDLPILSLKPLPCIASLTFSEFINVFDLMVIVEKKNEATFVITDYHVSSLDLSSAKFDDKST